MGRGWTKCTPGGVRGQGRQAWGSLNMHKRGHGEREGEAPPAPRSCPKPWWTEVLFAKVGNSGWGMHLGKLGTVMNSHFPGGLTHRCPAPDPGFHHPYGAVLAHTGQVRGVKALV